MEKVLISLNIELDKQFDEIKTKIQKTPSVKKHIYCMPLTYQYLEPQIDKLNYRPGKIFGHRIFIDLDVQEEGVLLIM